jgi:DNA gyrase subunit B
MTKSKAYDNTSISALKGADRVRLRPGVIFGSDDLEGCKHSFFEILSNSIDEAREGMAPDRGQALQGRIARGQRPGRGISSGFQRKRKPLQLGAVYCELYAGCKYNNISGDHYEFSLGLNGLGACATQYASDILMFSVVRGWLPL